jgi:putative addiction module killer protein
MPATLGNLRKGLEKIVLITYDKFNSGGILAMVLVQQFETVDGVKPFLRWVERLDAKTKARILARTLRFQMGNIGDYRHLGGGLCEAKLDFGAGYRIYFGMNGTTLILLLCGGDKSTQTKDIQLAEKYWKTYLGGLT